MSRRPLTFTLLLLTLLATLLIGCAGEGYTELSEGLAPAGEASSPRLQSGIETILEAQVPADGAGAVLMISTPKGDYVAARGLADVEAGTPLSVDDHFRIASASKPFLATVVLQLVDEGLVALDDPISTYLPAEISAALANAGTATVREVLSMSSGIPDYLSSDGFYAAMLAEPQRPWSAREAIEYAYGLPAAFAPGEGYDYSNSNYLLGEILIEEVTGSTLAAELDSRIFGPLGMSESFNEDPRNIGAGLVRGYGYGPTDQWEDITLWNNGIGLGDGGIVTTASDLALFLPALLNGELFSEEALAEMLAVIDDGEGGSYGLGISTWEDDHGSIYGHSGLSSGFQSEMYYLPEEQVGVIVLCNDETVEYSYSLVEAALAMALGG